MTNKKASVVSEVLKLYRQTAEIIAKFQWSLFFKTGSFNRKASIKHLNCPLSERFKSTIQYHVVVPTLKGFIGNVQERFKEIVLASTLPEKTKRVLLYLNSREEWLVPKSEKALWIDKDKNKHEYEIVKEERLLAKKIFKHILKSWKKPSFKGVFMLLDSKCALLERPKKAKGFDLWIRLSTHEKRKPIYLPVKLHEYFEERGGKLTGMVQIAEDGKLRLVKEVERKEIAFSGEVALDFGMECFLVSDRGDLFGRKFYSKVREFAEKIDRIQREMQKRGKKPTESKRYLRLQHRLSEYVKNEVRRVINRVIELYRPQRLVLEDLRGFLQRVINNFPKSVKRVLIRFGLGEIRRKLKEISEEYGIEVVYVNPAYSSQACSNCGYVDKENRKTRSEFECKLCNKKLHADVNASRNLLSRAKWSLHLRRMEQALTKQVEVFIKNLFSERFKCLWSKALGLIERNPYFQSVPKPEVWINVHKRDICPC
ncbi:MAG: transposase [Desulfurococcaceae archaeon]